MYRHYQDAIRKSRRKESDIIPNTEEIKIPSE